MTEDAPAVHLHQDGKFNKACVGSLDGNTEMVITTQGLMAIAFAVREKGIKVLRMGGVNLCVIQNNFYGTLAIEKSGVVTHLKCCIPKQGLQDQMLIIKGGEVLFHRGKDQSIQRKDAVLKLYPLPDQRQAAKKGRQS